MLVLLCLLQGIGFGLLHGLGCVCSGVFSGLGFRVVWPKLPISRPRWQETLGSRPSPIPLACQGGSYSLPQAARGLRV